MSATQNLTVQLGLSGLARVQAGLGSLTQSLGGLRSAAAAISSGLALGSVVRAVSQQLEQVAKIGDLSQSLGITAQGISGLSYAAKLNNVEMGELTKGLKALNEWMQRNRIEVASLDEALLQQAEVFAAMPDGPQKAALAVDRFGKAGLDLIPFLNEGREGIAKLTDEARRFGLVVDGDSVKAAERFTDDLERLKAAGEGATRQVAVGLAPALSEVTRSIKAATASGSLEGISKWVSIYASLKAEQFKNEIAPGTAGLFAGMDAYASALLKGIDPLTASVSAWAAMKGAVQGYAKALDETEEKADQTKKSISGLTAAMDDQQRMAKLVSDGLEVQRTLIGGDPGMTERMRREELRKLNAEMLRQLEIEEQALEAARAKSAVMFTNPDGSTSMTEEGLRFQADALALQRRRAGLLNERDALGASDGAMNWRDASVSIQNQFDELGNMARLTAQGFQSVFGTAIDSVSGGIQRLIGDTEYWSAKLGKIAGPIMGAVTSAISRMFTEWIAKRALLAVKNMFWSAKEGATDAAAKAPGALLTSISSWGVAAGVGLAAIIAAVASFGGFRSGGYTGDMGEGQVAGVVHGREYVFDAPAVSRIGVENLERLRAGQPLVSNAPASPAGGSAGAQVNIASFDSRQDARRWAQSQEAEVWFVDMAKRTANRWSTA